ncbi:MAG: glucose-1-phosphate thymidylyltransferase [Deltaproteobacteria bacterium]|nr:glucose-1-phosphate thymidylyltransferase [Deltaproteobacteria bacterium]
MGDFSSPASFFELAPDHPLAGRLAATANVWEILDLLGDWIQDLIVPNVASLRRGGGLVERPMALRQGEAAPAEVDFNGPGGRVMALVGGQPWPEAALILPGAYVADDRVEIGPGALVEAGAMIKGPAIIGPGAQVRQGAYVRGQVYAGAEAVVGHATEAKNVLMLDGAKAGHFAYLGDSVLGREVNLGAGTKLANLNMGDAPIAFKANGELITLKRRKMGAILGDRVETGCNSVTNPGVLMGPDSRLWPNVAVKAGYYPPKSRIRG